MVKKIIIIHFNMYRGFLFYELVVNVSSRENKETSNDLNKNTLVIFQETLRSTDPLPHLLRALLYLISCRPRQ